MTTSGFPPGRYFKFPFTYRQLTQHAGTPSAVIFLPKTITAMEEIIKKINQEYPTWVAIKQLETPKSSDEKAENGRKPNGNSCSLEQAAINLITTAQA